MVPTSRRATAALGVIVSIATGLVTNLLTGSWSPTLAVALGVLLIVGIVLAIRTTDDGGGGRTLIRTIAEREGQIRGSSQKVGGGGASHMIARDGGRIEDSHVEGNQK